MSEKHIGKVIQVTGPVLDIRFPEGELPALLNAIEIDNHGEKLIVEVAQQTGDHTVRCIAMKSTDGLVRGTAAVSHTDIESNSVPSTSKIAAFISLPSYESHLLYYCTALPLLPEVLHSLQYLFL